MIILAITLIGLCLGSFINALVWRLHQNKDWIKERSICPHCKHELAATDLIPVLSWLLLRGKCRYCHKSISPQYPLVELVTALSFVGSYLFWPYDLVASGIVLLTVWLVILVGLIALAVYDLKWMLLPDKLVYPFTACSIGYVIILALSQGVGTLLSAVVGALVISGLFYILFQLSQGKWIGGGDVKISIMLGLLAGGFLEALLVIFIASLIGTFVSIPLLLKKGKRSHKVPFGPFLIAATIIVVIFGTTIIEWYKTQFLHL